MTVRVYRSTDAGAPTMNNSPGSLIAVLDWCLVSGAPISAGWTKEYSGTNKAVYKQGAGSNGFYLRVDDTTTYYASITGYETMSDVDTGTKPFPRPHQTIDATFATSFFYICKSDNSNSNPREWVIVATEKLFYIYANRSSTSGVYLSAMINCFGDFESFSSTDQYNTIIIGTTQSTATSNSFPDLIQYNSAQSGHCIARAYHQHGGSIYGAKRAIQTITDSTMGLGNVAYPDPVTGDLKILPVYVGDADGSIAFNPTRGRMPGLWAMIHSLPFNHGDTFSGKVGTSLEGKTFEVFRCAGAGNAQVIIETSDTW